MLAVIFSATIKNRDDEYRDMALRLQDLALSEYGCVEFTSVTEGNVELTVSYWNDEGQILAWKKDPEHQAAQELGRCRWYDSYQVTVARIEKEYGN